MSDGHRRRSRSGARRRRCGRPNNVRAAVAAPMLREGVAIGAILLRKTEAGPVHAAPDRAARDLRCPGRHRHRERAPVHRDPGEEPPARDRQPAQVAVPRQHEPRAAHAAQRHHRLHRDDGRRALRRRAREGAGRAGARAEQRPAPARPDQRRARPLQDRGRPARADDRGVQRRRHGGDRAVGHRIARPRQEPRARLGRGARPADRHRRCAATDPGAAEPGRQCHQVHRPGLRSRSARPRSATASSCRWSTPASASRPADQAQDLRGVPAGRQHQHAQEGRHRSRALDLAPDRRAAWRPHHRQVRGRQGLDLQGHRSRSTPQPVKEAAQ